MTGKKKPLKRDEMVRILRRQLRASRQDTLATMNTLTATRDELARVRAIANHNGQRGLEYYRELQQARVALLGAAMGTFEWLLSKGYIRAECAVEARASIENPPLEEPVFKNPSEENPT